jgi:hypothetical protein
VLTDPEIDYDYADLKSVFERLRLSRQINDMLVAFDDIDLSSTIGFHIRRPYPNGAFEELETSKFFLAPETFIDLIRDLREALPSYDRMLLSTNDPALEAAISQAFRDYILRFEKSTIDNTQDALAVQQALVDFTLLSRCRLLFSQEGTSFGHFAHVVGGNELICVLRATTDSDYRFSRLRHGQQCEDFAVQRGAGAPAELRRHLTD